MSADRSGGAVRFSAASRWLLGCLVPLALYALLVPWVWEQREWTHQGPLAYRAGATSLADDVRLVSGGPTAGEVREKEHDEYGSCSADTVYVVLGGSVAGEPYYAVYDVEGGDVCTVGIYRARDGTDLYMDAVLEAVRVAKAGGAWPYLGTVKSETELWLGAAFLVTVVLQGLAYFRRARPPLGWPVTGVRDLLRKLQLAALVLSVGAWAFVTLDVVFLPDLLGGLVTGLLGLELAWVLLAGRYLLEPADSWATPWEQGTTAWGRISGVRWSRGSREPKEVKQEAPVPEPGPAASEQTSVRLISQTSSAPKSAFQVTHTGELPHYSDLGGMAEVKAFLDDTLGLLLAFADEAEDYRITFNGILLHGPPGVGKTFLAKAVAGEYGLSFVHVTAGDLSTGISGGGARRVVEAFDTAAANVPCVLFFDEFDAVAQERGSEPDIENRRTVAQLLTSLEKHRALSDLVVMAATNDLESLDSAVVRPGRFDRHVRVDLPDAAAREAVLLARLRDRPLEQQLDLAEVVRRTEGRSPALLASVVESASLMAFREATRTSSDVPITSDHLLRALESLGGRDRPTVERWSWDRLVLPAGVLEELQQLQRMLEDPEVARAYGISPPSGLLLAGPPGTGKTTVARVLAAEAGCSFYPVTAADLTSKWVGESEDAVRSLFRRARDNAPSIIFLDEVDAVAGARGRLAEHGDRLLDQLLVEIDGLGSRGAVFVLAATNRPDMLDPALLRGGRLSRTLWLELPDAEQRQRLLALLTEAMPLVGVDLVGLADDTAGMSGADIAALCQQAALAAMTRRTSGPAVVVVEDFDQARQALAAAPPTEGSV